MATRLIGTDSADPRLPQGVIDASQGTTVADLAPGNTLAEAIAYANALAATIGGGGGGAATITFTTRAALNTLAATSTLAPGTVYLVTDETPDHVVVTNSTSTYVNLATVSEYRPPAPIGDLRSIAEENALSGYAEANWQIAGIGDTGALGYATEMSVRAGSTIEFKVHSGNVGYSIEIVRLGWYGGAGARLVDTLAVNGGSSQPNGTLRSNGEGGVGSRDCAAWTVTDRWSVPDDATNGVYLAVVKRVGRSTWSHIGPFTVDNELGDQADICCLLSDMTWRAYNAMGTVNDPLSGKSLYGSGAGTFAQGGRSWDVTYDTPLVINGAVAQTSYWNGERPIHAWLERNGYSVHYASCLDVDRDPSRLAGHNVMMMCGHAEYLSQGVRDAWDSAIAAGSHAVVASGNTMLWRVRMAGRTMVCYKNSHSFDGVGVGIDPGSWTGTWRDTRWEDRQPEAESIGAVFVANGIRQDSITVPAAMAAEPLWRDTSVNGLIAPEVETLKAGCLGFEWDTFEPSYGATLRYPPGLKFLSATPVNLTGNAANEDGSIYTTTINPCTHRIVAYKHGSALVVNFGTNQWGWGLSDAHVRGTAGENTTMKQATVNLLADMGCQPATIEPELTEATDQLSAWTFPTMLSLSLPDVAAVPKESTATLRALAVWSNGISTDLADHVTWTSDDEDIATVKEGGVVYGVAQGDCVISGSYGVQTDSTALTVGPKIVPRDTWLAPNYAYSGTIYSDGAITLGTQFRKTSTGSVFIAGVRYWRSTITQTAAPVGYCARVGFAVSASKTSTFSTPATAGWEYLIFDTPVEVTTADPHIVWVWLPSGGYGAIPGYFSTARLSRLGLFDSTATAGAGKFRQPPGGSPDTSQPVTPYGNNFYLVEPLVTAEVVIPDPGDPVALDIVPTSVTMAVGATQQLAGMLNWENISPTNETAFTGWTSSVPARATVSTGGIVTGVTVGNTTVTGIYNHATAGTFTDTCPVTVAPIAHGWTGATPTANGDNSALELGTWFTVGTATTIIGVRIWNPGLVAPAAGEPRTARLWVHDGFGGTPTVQRTVALPDVMPAGWSEYTFANFSATTTGFYCVSYFVHAPSISLTTADYGAVSHGFDTPIVDRISFPAGAGHFHAGPPGVFPADTVVTNPFYAVDVIYADV